MRPVESSPPEATPIPSILTHVIDEQQNRRQGDLVHLLHTVKAYRQGDFTVRCAPTEGVVGEIGEVLNDIMELHQRKAKDFARVARTVAHEGKMSARAAIGPVQGAWATSIDSVNSVINDLVLLIHDVARVITSVARGDLTQKMDLDLNGRPLRGEFSRIARTVNTMVDQLNSFAAEVTRVAKEVGTEGKLGGQANVRGLSGTWKDLTDNVNSLAGNLTAQVRNIAKVTTAVAKGDLSQKITVDARGEILELKNTINTMVDQLNSFAAEVTRVAKEVGTEGKLGGQANVRGVSGTWKDLTDNVNSLAGNLTAQVRNIAKVTTAVAKGDLSQKITVDARGEILELKNTINTMVDQLNSFAAEVTRVAKEVGTEGKLGGQADVRGVSGTWKGLTDNVNSLASNLTKQVRGIIKVVTAIATGDLSQKFVLEAKGEVAALAETINSMTDTLRIFADQVTTVAREVGIEGKLGGQAKVPGAAGTWKDLTDNVNQLAGNLTTQVRAIAEVSTAVTQGDLTRSISVKAQGEVAALKDNINQMIANLKDTTEENTEQDWLKTNLAKFTGMMQGQRSISAVSQLIMSELTPLVSAQYGTFFMMEAHHGEPSLNLKASYAVTGDPVRPLRYRLKEGLVGQCAFERKRILLADVPSDFVRIGSSMGEARPRMVVVLPVLFEGEVEAVIELASFQPFRPIYLKFLTQLMDSIGVVLNVISSTMRTEELLQAVKRSNAELEAQAKELEDKAKLLEIKNREVEQASLSLEEKAEQLALISRYKSEFLANMSHELRTPLNSLLILSKMLAENKSQNLTPDQVKFANTVYSSGCDLLALINEILDLSKVEAGKMPVEPEVVRLTEIQETLEQTFGPVARHKDLHLSIDVAPGVPDTLYTDRIRLLQILKNLLSNGLKFTERGNVSIRIYVETDTTRFTVETLQRSPCVLAFAVQDTGIGIPRHKQEMIFEAFQQGDGTTNRKYGGTGLGLTISREIARLLGGFIDVSSTPGIGSTFILYLPQTYVDTETTVRTSTFPEEIPALPMPEEGSLSGKRILIIDDDQRNIFAIQSALEAQGISVLSANNGKDGMHLLGATPDIDLVIMDVMMPQMDGLEATRMIRKSPQFARLPIICLTAKAMKGDREKSIAAGASDYITKPVDPEKLLSRIHTWLESSRTAGL